MTDQIRPVAFEWTPDQVMKPEVRFLPLCDRQYVVHEIYVLVPFEQRSTRAHNHLFAVLNDAWENLPEQWAQRFPSAEHLRKWLLVKAGHATHAQFNFDTPKDAMTFARGLRRYDEYAIISVSGTSVDVWTAKSISRRAVPTKDEFQRIKNNVLDGVELLTGNSRQEIEREASQKMLPPAHRATFEGGEK